MGASSTRSDPRRRLTTLRNGLLRLHKALLDSERDVYDHDIQRITSSGQLLGLVMHDPHFAWLHELSELVVVIDEVLEGDPPELLNADRLVAQARALLVPDEEGQGFERRYFEALQRDPGVVLAHADMMRLMAEL